MDILIDLNPLSGTYLDWVVENGDLQLTNNQQGILQNILQTLKVYLGEWFMNTNIGIDYFGQILVKNPQQEVINAIFISAILNVPGVIQLNEYSFTPNFITRQLEISFLAQTTTGLVDYTGLL